jgi:hypothetical protein
MILTFELASRPIVTPSVVAAGVFLIVLVFGCASNNSVPSNPPAAAAAIPAAQATPPPGSVLVASWASSSTAAGATKSGAAPTQEHLVGVGSATVVTIHGKIVSVNRAKRLVTLVGPDGKQVTVQVYNPYNLAAAKPGAPFVAKFYEIVTVRKKHPGESLPAASLAEGIVSAVPGQIPGAVAGTSVQLVVTVDAVSPHKETITVEGPDRKAETVNVANPTNLKYVKLGDQIVITLTNVVAIALESDSDA